jgi:uncharacterized protein (TIGR02145 family)
MSTNGDNIQSSICPKGWKIPSGKTDDSDVAKLIKAYDMNIVRFINDTGFSYAGYVYNTYMSDYVSSYNTNIGFWSSTISAEDRAYAFSASSTGSISYSISVGKSDGRMVHCMLR